MTNSPQDLIEFRYSVMALTGLTDPAQIGIVGDGAHQRTGGYHEGKDVLVANGMFGAIGAGSTDYSVRLTRDHNGCTNSASAIDIGYHWPQGGDAAWLRYNNMLVAQLKVNDPALSAIRAVNYSPDGSAKYRIDREYGWSRQGTSDVVDIHTHHEYYRDTEAKRSTTLARQAQIMQAAIAGTSLPASSGSTGEDEMTIITAAVPEGFAFDETGKMLDRTGAVVPAGTVAPEVPHWGMWLTGAPNGVTFDVFADWATYDGADLHLNVAAHHGGGWDIRTAVLTGAGTGHWYWAPGGLPDGTDAIRVCRQKASASDTRDAAPIHVTLKL